MKSSIRLRSFLALAGSSLLAMSSASALTYYWDSDDSNPGFGSATGTWAVPTAGTLTSGWSTDATGATAIDANSVTTLTTDAVNFGNTTTGLGSGIINLSGTVDSGNMTFAAASGPITLSGGTLTLSASPAITVNNAVNTIASNLAGTGTGFKKAGAGTLVLSGTNANTGIYENTGGGTLIFRGTAALNNRQINVNTGTGTYRIESDTGFSSASTAGFQSYGTGVMNLQVDRQTAGSGAALTYTFSGASNLNDIANGATVNFSAGPNITSGTPTINFANGIRSNSASSLSPLTLNADGVNVRFNGFSAGNSGRDKPWVLGGTSTGNEIYGGITNASSHRHAITKNGTGTWTLSGENSYLAATIVNAGTLAYTRDLASGTPFGIDAMTINAGILKIAPAGTGSAVAFTGGTEAANTNFTFNAGATLELAKGTQTSLTYTFGFSGAGTAFARGTNGTLILSTSDLANFGSAGGKTERFIINSGSDAPATVNGIVSGVVIQNRNSSNAGDFAGYDATDGFTEATYSVATDFTGSTSASVLDLASAATSGATAAYALRVSGTVTNTGNTLTLGSSGNATAGLILNGGTISGGTLTTPDSSATEFAIYTSGTSAISSSISTATSQAGVSVFGPGTLNWSDSSGNSFTGGLRILNSTVITDDNAQLGGSTSAIALTGGTLQTSGTFALGGGQRAIVLSAGQNQSGGTINVASGTTTYQNASSGTKIMSGTGSLTKTGAGTLVLSGNTGNTYSGGTFVNQGTLQLGAANKLLDAGRVVIGAGTLDAATFDDTVGTLDVTDATSTINLGSGANLAFASSSAVVWTGGTLNLTGTLDFTGTNTSSLRFGTNSSGLTAAQLGSISASGWTNFALNASGYLTADSGSGSAYDAWKAANAPGSNPDDDTDGDGVTNAVEFVLGGTSATKDLGKLPVPDASGGNLTFTFERDQDSIDPKTALFIETSTDLVTWNTSPSPYTVPDVETVGPPVTVEDNLDGTDTIILTVPKAPDAKKFARLKVIITP